jgi:hypothetical protein
MGSGHLTLWRSSGQERPAPAPKGSCWRLARRIVLRRGLRTSAQLGGLLCAF